MKNLTLTLLLSLLVTTHASALDDCVVENSSFSELTELAEVANEVTGTLSETQKVLNLTVTKFGSNQGSGKVSVLTDEDGNLTGIRVDFTLKGKKTTLLKTFDQLKSGGKLEYFEGKSTTAALVVKKAYNHEIYPQTGGRFTFSVLAKKPKSYMHYNLYLRKEGANWVVKNENGAKKTSVDLTPNVSGFDWDGTFSEAEFE